MRSCKGFWQRQQGLRSPPCCIEQPVQAWLPKAVATHLSNHSTAPSTVLRLHSLHLLQKSQRKTDSNWINIAKMSEFPADRPTKAIVLKDKSVVMLYNINGKVYCSDANSTAYKYPLSHAKILPGKSGPAVEVPLDGTIYDLETGKVLEWCPKNNLIRKFLGAIKSNQEPVKLKVYPAQVDDAGIISVRFYNPGAATS